MKKRPFLKSIITTSSFIGISRISGFLRELVFSFFIGTSEIMDAFVIAYMIPNFFRRILGEKAAESVFIPMYIRQKERGKVYSDDYMSKVFSVLGIILIVLVVLFYPIAPVFIRLVAPGFNASTFDIALKMTFLILPYMFFIGIYAFLGALLESHKKFALYNFSPFVFNITLILFIIFLYNKINIHAITTGVIIGVILQTAVLFFSLTKLNIKFVFKPNFKDKDIKDTGKLLIPITMGSGIEKLSIYVDRIMASLLPIGSISSLYFAFRLIDLPFAVFSIAIGKVIHPYISSKSVYEDMRKFRSYIFKGVLLNFAILIPISIVFAFFAKIIVQLVFMRGSFDMNSVNMTYQPLIYYTIGLTPMGIVALFSRAFYALLDTKTPLKVAFFSAIINVILNIILMPKMGISGLALGTSISIWFNAIYLYILLERKIRRNNEM